jgi:hypothetical protein
MAISREHSVESLEGDSVTRSVVRPEICSMSNAIAGCLGIEGRAVLHDAWRALGPCLGPDWKTD